MADIRVLVVDDSTTMRALFCGMFDNAKGIQVLDHAASAAEAREVMRRARPDVVTLDIEMPGMNGLDFLEEIMRERPLPVIMLSTLTQKGAASSIRAMELGAFDCFPKPTIATRDEFERITPKLVALVKAAASGKTTAARKKVGQAAEDGFRPNGRVVALSASSGGVAALMQIVPAFPAACPPTIITIPLEPGMGDSLIGRLDAAARPRIRPASDGQRLEPGNVYIAADQSVHVIVDGAAAAEIKTTPADPVNGARPSASLLFATLAKTAGASVVAGVLTGTGTDGCAGLQALKLAGATTFAQSIDTAAAGEAPAAALATGAAQRPVPLGEIAKFVLDQCRDVAHAA
ncbi:chemotaxis response regulator protein-glutamate methylesterase [Sphingomonas metalli]|uniref:protein-glutamate methylesterase n=1 Tax=Sphingomonas metalli TaxID=1779358 RepID=A0A916TFG5_9SPHN|nr:chemotaxis protein CheB [Sphingomonas metalli]GGB40499.1 chemotaxis response regulator protein-glutamate methylesterase [Sphingomonas metalli]